MPRGIGMGHISTGGLDQGYACPNGVEGQMLVSSELRVGEAPTTIVGEITAGSAIMVLRTVGDWSAIAIRPCEITPMREGDSFWVPARSHS